MSKMSQLHLTLDEQAMELGFEGLGEALMKGYDVDYEKGKLIRRGLGYSETVEYLIEEQEKAHEAWLEERASVLADLRVLRDDIWEENHDDDMRDALTRTIVFIERGEV